MQIWRQSGSSRPGSPQTDLQLSVQNVIRKAAASLCVHYSRPRFYAVRHRSGSSCSLRSRLQCKVAEISQAMLKFARNATLNAAATTLKVDTQNFGPHRIYGIYRSQTSTLHRENRHLRPRTCPNSS